MRSQRLLEKKKSDLRTAVDQARAMDIAQKQPESYTHHQTPTVNAVSETEVESSPLCTCDITAPRTTIFSFFFFFLLPLDTTVNDAQQKIPRVTNVGGKVIKMSRST